MKVCVGITTKNRKEILTQAINSALNQNYTNLKVFVFDDGSTDGTFDLKTKYPEVRWERSEESLGLLEARNRMMRTSDADIFISLDDDAWFLKNDEIAIAVRYFQENENLGAIGFDILENGTMRFKEVPRENPIPTNFFMGAGHALRLNIVKKVGYYVPFPVRYGHEEKDLAIRILNEGYEMLMLPGVHVWHDYTKIERNTKDQNYGFVINDLVYKFRRVPILYLPPVLGLSIWRTLMKKVRHGISGSQAVLQFIKMIPSQMKYVKRVKIETYKEYRSLSKTYLEYISKNKQL